MFFSVVIPVYNRPQEVDELLESLTSQTYTNFEVLIIEDGSEDHCKEVVKSYKKELDIRYYFKENSGQGFSRNYGFERAKGDFFVVFDSDCLIPSHYFETVNNYLKKHSLDAYGGPDRKHKSFTPVQKAISYAMTSPITTGGIRGNKNHAGTFHPRSFNMGISRKVYEETGGYRITRMGEDIEFSLRIINHGFSTGLIPDAYVYHKRRTDLIQFFKQLHFFGRARINISRFFPSEVKLIHWLPALFTLGTLFLLSLPLWNMPLFDILVLPYLALFLLIFVHSWYINDNIFIGLLGTVASFTQLTAYGIGFMSELWTKLRE
ncbi:Glycosyltransferase, catalytic subunit of cellulose synthase and poly-beta-1,6-N-acetylglucosamine synthase [Fodinibius salinus]|uniref:Glycosyltransferase, catalytic subunit of cellulose synthase and poly-beta-1,6-N-acetylglucosamine synthase n=1 Tax=Fodinibius salinus TaxID=860790 RepID=A0A5D3YSQ7_9BACT|nr:glycosyltransferase [Fodinibius salinus]TYP95601.1 Glycosyltransferase, catalytic subunit of cellulose synthase and poly-beta-1,6-N-acetylglucosamine synthase [Fodinibius salinus]